MAYDQTRTRVEFLAAIAKANGVQRYLEIGVQSSAQCFDHVPAAKKHGVDPNGGGATHVMTSDAFFATLDPDAKYDLIFIDGDHNHEQVCRDVNNALLYLAADGVLVMHDCMPPTRDHENPCLCGTAWRAFAQLRTWSGVEAFCGDFDMGVGCARRGVNSSPVRLPCDLKALTYDHFLANKEAWFRPRSFEQLLQFATGQG